MPTLRCTNPECEHEWHQRSWLAVGEICPECESESELADAYEEPIQTPSAVEAQRTAVGARLPEARACARKLLHDQRITTPPVPLPALARLAGLTIVEREALGELRGRLRGDTIEVSKGFPPVAQRFVVAHELGHHFMETTHESGPFAEQEANAFANELLVPGAMLHAALLQTTECSELRRRFGVSQQVLEIAARYHKVAGKLTGS